MPRLGGPPPRVEHDVEANAAYIPLAPIDPSGVTANAVVERAGRGDIVLDFDNDGYLVGIEVIGADTLLRSTADH